MLQSLDNSADIFNALSNMALTVDDADVLLNSAYSIGENISEFMLSSSRKKHLAYLMAEQGIMVGNLEQTSSINLPKHNLNR